MGRGGARARALAPWLVGALAFAASPTSAQDEELVAPAPPATASTLTLEAPAECPTAELLQSELASLVGRPLEEIALPEGLDAHVVVTLEGPRFALEVHDTEEGARTLRDRSCAALVRAAALIIALRIDADAATLAAATAAEPEPEPPAETTPPPRPIVPVRPARRRARPEHAFEWSTRLGSPYPRPTLAGFALGGGVWVEGGLVPSFTVAFAIDAIARADHFELRAHAAYALDQAQDAAHPGIAASALVATVLLCGRPLGAEFAIAFCGGAEGGTLFASSYGVSDPRQNVGGTLAGVLGVWLPLFPWRGIDISIGIEGWGRVYRPEFVISGIGTVWSADWFGGRFALLTHFSP